MRKLFTIVLLGLTSAATAQNEYDKFVLSDQFKMQLNPALTAAFDDFRVSGYYTGNSYYDNFFTANIGVEKKLSEKHRVGIFTSYNGGEYADMPRFNLILNYAYALKIGKGEMNVGVSISSNFDKIDLSKYIYGDMYDNRHGFILIPDFPIHSTDPRVQNYLYHVNKKMLEQQYPNQWNYSLSSNFGVAYQLPKFYIGFAFNTYLITKEHVVFDQYYQNSYNAIGTYSLGKRSKFYTDIGASFISFADQMNMQFFLNQHLNWLEVGVGKFVNGGFQAKLNFNFDDLEIGGRYQLYASQLTTGTVAAGYLSLSYTFSDKQ